MQWVVVEPARLWGRWRLEAWQRSRRGFGQLLRYVFETT